MELENWRIQIAMNAPAVQGTESGAEITKDHASTRRSSKLMPALSGPGHQSPPLVRNWLVQLLNSL